MAGRVPAGHQSAWIGSAVFDLAFFILAPLSAIPLLLLFPDPNGLATLAVVSLVGFPHYLSTFTFFFWGEAREDHARHRVLYFVFPGLILAVVGAMVVLRVPYVLQAAVYVWNTIHVARQSCGILSIYRQRRSLGDAHLKSTANAAIVWTSVAMAFWNIESYPTMDRFMSLAWTGLPRAVIWVTCAGAAVALARLSVSLWKRAWGTTPPRLPEMAFLATSLVLFHPYLWIEDANRATFGTLIGHFIQYLALVWLVHRRRDGRPGRQSPSWLRQMSRSLPVLGGSVAVIGGALFALQLGLRGSSGETLLQAVLIALALVHFYLDGVFWAFKRPEVRRHLAPLLGPPSSPVPAH